MPMLTWGQSYTPTSVPNPKSFGSGYVSDPQNYLSSTEKQSLNAIANAIEDSTGAQVAIVMLPSIGEENPKDFAVRLFEVWGIGQKEADNGLLILSVIDQRRTEFETGYGMEGVLPDAICYQIGMQQLVPHFKVGDYGKGLEAVMLKIQEILYNPEVAAEFRYFQERNNSSKDNLWKVAQWYGGIALVLHLMLLVWVILTLWNKEDLYDKYKSIRPLKAWGFMIPFPIPYIFAYFILGAILKRLRYHPRFSKVTGNKMRLLSEEEEDDFLEQGNIVEEEIGSVDYDVWIDEEGEEVLILRYTKRFSKYGNCPECNFITYFLAHTEVLRAASYSSSGEQEVIHECKNCAYRKVTIQVIPRKTRSSSSGGGGGGGSWGGGSSGGGGAGVSW